MEVPQASEYACQLQRRRYLLYHPHPSSSISNFSGIEYVDYRIRYRFQHQVSCQPVSSFFSFLFSFPLGTYMVAVGDVYWVVDAWWNSRGVFFQSVFNSLSEERRWWIREDDITICQAALPLQRTNFLIGFWGEEIRRDIRNWLTLLLPRLSVLSAITSTQQKLKLYNRVPDNGLCVFVGTVLNDEGKEKKISFALEPFKPINTSLYMCDSRFHVEALEELLENDSKWGFIVM